MVIRILLTALMVVGVLAIGYVTVSALFDDGRSDAPRAVATGAMDSFRFAGERRALPDTTVTGPGDSELNLSSLAGNVVVLNLWATWCAPCVKELPSLAELSESFEGRDVRVVTVNMGRESAAEARAFLDKHGAQRLPAWTDITLAIGFEVSARGLPTTLVYNREGVEIGRISGDADWASQEAKRLVEAALRGEIG
jgi:thiol-disulfide isomerase/thioredoxin